MARLSLTRKEYDFLVENFQPFMEKEWKKLGHNWWIGGVEVSGPFAVLDKIAREIENF